MSQSPQKVYIFPPLLVDTSFQPLNLYFSEIRPEKWQDQSTGRWLTSPRITGSTYPASLAPPQKRDLIQIDAIIVFNDKAHYLDAVKRSYRYVADQMMSKGSFNQTLTLIE